MTSRRVSCVFTLYYVCHNQSGNASFQVNVHLVFNQTRYNKQNWNCSCMYYSKMLLLNTLLEEQWINALNPGNTATILPQSEGYKIVSRIYNCYVLLILLYFASDQYEPLLSLTHLYSQFIKLPYITTYMPSASQLINGKNQ